MKNLDLNKKKNIHSFLFISISLISFFTIYQINYEDLWFDELYTFWLTNPQTDNSITYKNVIFYEGTPPLYYFVIKFYYKLFGYRPELIRYPNIIFNIFSLLFFFQILKKISDSNKFIFFALFLFSLNHFLISYGKEGRVFIFYCFTVLFFINSYLSITSSKTNKINFLSIFLLILSGVLCLMTHLFSYLVIVSMIVYQYLFNKKNNNNFLIFFIFILILILSFFLNLDYIKKILTFKLSWITQPDLNFYFFNFFFKQFFGSKVMGYIFFIVFIYSIYLILKKKIYLNKIKFFLLTLILTYSLTIIYGYISNPILRDRYIIYVVPIIIIIISFGLTLNSSSFNSKLVIFLITVSFFNLIFKIYKGDYHKPQFTSLVNDIHKYNQKSTINFYSIFYDSENKINNNILSHYLINKNFINVNLVNESNTNKKNIWLICYDPSNVFDKCLSNKNINQKKYKVNKTIKKYLVIAYLLN